MGRPKKVRGTFSKIPEVIALKGRVAGFEYMRDFVLDNWDSLKSQVNPYSAIKLALEADRHAMFAEVAELRKQGRQAEELSGELSDYLRGKIDAAPDATGERVSIDNTSGGFGTNFDGIDSLLESDEPDAEEDE